MKTSISSFVHYRFSLNEAVRRYAKMGYDQVEIWGGRPHAYWEDMNTKTLAELNDTLKESGLTVSAWIPAQFRYPTNLASPIEDMRLKSVDYIKRNFEAAAAVNAPYVSVCPGFCHVDLGWEVSWEALIKSLNELVRFAGNAESDSPTIMLEPANR